MNNVTLVGRLTKDPELKIGANQREVVNFTLAVTRDYKNKEGEYESDFITCSAFGASAKYLSQYGLKGDLVNVIGSIRVSVLEPKTNNTSKIFWTEVNCNKVSILSTRAERMARGNAEPITIDAFDSTPTAPAQIQQNEFIIGDDDLPF